jgi:MFS family permease
MGSLTAALAPNLPVLVFGWSVLEGIVAGLIMPAIVALVAANPPAKGRPAAYGLVMGAGAGAVAVAVAVGPLIGGIATTYFSWRWVFAGEVVIVLGIRLLGPPRQRHATGRPGAPGRERRLHDRGRAGPGGFRCAAVGGVGLGAPQAKGPSLFGVSPTLWLIRAGLLTIWIFFEWEVHVEAAGRGRWGGPRSSPTAR